ncbi:MAG: A/G-specific adenine glycosylase [Bacteroidota bacterium]
MAPLHERAFRVELAEWFLRHQREMPWRKTGTDGRRNPYHVWLAEVMLQQTRVDTATPYFLRFIEAFPSIDELAAAPLDDVLKLWEGLGYYSRARNLHRAAQVVVQEHAGGIPDTDEAFRALPGVGPYTSAAVLSLAFGRPLAVLDGNVIRVLARVFALDADVKQGAARKRLQKAMDHLLDPDHPGRFNEAVMELGATVCTPRSPACSRCPLRSTCSAFAAGSPEAYPVSSKAKPVPHHTIVAGLIRDTEGHLLIQRRPEDAMLGGLWEFPGGKAEPGETLPDACQREILEETGLSVQVGEEVGRVKHAYSHFRITMHAFSCVPTGGELTSLTGEPQRWVSPTDLDDYAFPRANRRILDQLQEDARAPRLF